MKYNEHINVNNIEHKLKEPNIKCLLVFTIILSLNEIFYIILLCFSNDLYKISFILNIVKLFLISCLLISNLYIISYQKIRIFLNSENFVNIEKKLRIACIIFSISVVIMSFLANFLYKFISMTNPNNPLCPYSNFCQIKKIDSDDYYYYFCNYRPNKKSSFIDIDTCQKITNENINFLKKCEYKYKCELATTDIEEENTIILKIVTLVLGIILFVFWCIIMVYCVYNSLNSDYKMLTKNEKITRKLYVTLRSEDKYVFVLCQHNKIEKNFDFDYDDLEILPCTKCENDESENGMELDQRLQKNFQ